MVEDDNVGSFEGEQERHDVQPNACPSAFLPIYPGGIARKEWPCRVEALRK